MQSVLVTMRSIKTEKVDHSAMSVNDERLYILPTHQSVHMKRASHQWGKEADVSLKKRGDQK